MDKLHKDILIRLRKNIIDDLDVDNDIIQPLRNEYILTEDHIRNIYVGATKEERAAKLLDILPLCGSSAFGVFHQSLKHHYDWLSDEIDRMLGNYEIETNGVTDYYAGPLIPPLSPLTVTREEKVNQLKKALQELIPTEYIALHGMKGFGKSSLVASTLKDIKLVKTLFSNQVYWIKFANDSPLDEEILIQLNTLYYNVRNLEIQPELFTPLARNSLSQYLKFYFSKQENCNALLILDDVHNEQIINTFDFKCKTLVLTDNIDVVFKKRPKTIEMNDGFTEAETLGLFAKALEMENVKKLPAEAKRIYEECKGMPLLIAMFAAQFEEFKCDMRIHTRRWEYYLTSLREKSTTNKVMNDFWEKQETIFDMCIKQLKPDLKEYYESLAIFCEDVNITSKTLEIFWRKEALEIEELMLDLCHKSLAARIYNNDLKTYIYGVHDLLLTHLRKKLTDDELIHMHKSIIEKYRQYCNNDFSKLPDDNYIYSYIGYHLEQAKLFEEFPHLYLNFDFIQAKLTHASLNDLLLDLRKYRKYITLNDTDVDKVFDLEIFLQEQASIIVEHKHKKCLDIIQIAMNHSSQGYITQTAKDLAMRRQEFLYLSHKNSSQHANISSTEEIPTNICTSSFANDTELVLTGNTSGKIILWDFQGKHRKIFNGHGEECSIKKVIVSMACDCFLSLSSAGIIKLFSLSEESNETFDQYYMNIESPRQRQSFWSNLYSNLRGQDDSSAEFKVENEIILDMAFGHEEKYIAACTNKATIQIWDRNGNTMFTLTDPKYQYITKIAFTHTTNASLLHIMDESKGAFFVFTNYGNDYTYRYVTCYNLQLNSASKEVIFFHHVPQHDDSLIVVTKKEALYVKWCRKIDNCVYNFNRKLKGYIDETVTYVCATITYDGEYIILADSTGFISVWNADSGFQPVAIYKSRVISLDSFWLIDQDCHVICGNGNGALYRWKFLIQKSNDLPRKCLFDAIVSCDEMDIIVKQSPSKKITVSYGENKIRESKLIKGEISNLQLSANGKALYVKDNKIIELLNTRTGETMEVLEVEKPIKFVKIISLCNRDVIICRWEDDNLKIWQPPAVFNIGTKEEESIHDIHIINDNYIITIMQNGKIKIWYTYRPPWQLISQVDLSNPSSNIIFSCLSYNQKYLAILDESYRLTLLDINYDNIAAPSQHIQINEQPRFTHSFAQKAICCDISKNEQYIAVGLESGQISIINIQKRMEITQLFFNANPITQLYWAPVAIEVPILLSLTNDELIWWNVALAKNDMTRTQNMRSRMMSRSISAPSFSSNAFWNQRVPNSRSIDVDVSRVQDEEISSTASSYIVNISSYWKNKKGKNPEIPELLTVVKLPQSHDGKICISPNFTKYVMVDMYGSVNTFKLIDYDEFILRS